MVAVAIVKLSRPSHHRTQSIWTNFFCWPFLLKTLSRSLRQLLSDPSPRPLDMDLFNSAPRIQLFPLGPLYLVPSARYIPQPPSLGPLGSTHMAPSTPTHFGFAHTAPCTFPAQTTRPDRALILLGTPPFVPSLTLGSLHSGHSYQANLARPPRLHPLGSANLARLTWIRALGLDH